ncbi:hypothetical protein PV327_004568 [Microctonus hyperodae]|uniref:Uncharacterized protein n=1 Tax=Microctonus hyperodae TaxID=165561 RepID=A0AA39FCZ4_MICHY|nr:hypothetical protein PV327_004568 [Microctonus hyperodae]
MDNINNNFDSIDKLKKRKIDMDHFDDFNETFDIKHKKVDNDECLRKVKYGSTSLSHSPKNVDNRNDSDQLPSDNEKKNFTFNALTSPTVELLSNVNIGQEDDNVNKLNTKETIDWKCLLMKVEDLEDKITNKVCLNIAILNKTWMENINETKCIYQSKINELILRINELERKNAEITEENQAVIKEKHDLEIKLILAQNKKLELFGVQSKNVLKLENKKINGIMNEGNQSCDGQMGQPNEDKIIDISVQNGQIEKHSELAQNLNIRHDSYGAYLEKISEINFNQDSSIPASLKKEMPPMLPVAKLTHEITMRRERRCNIIVKGLKPTIGDLTENIKEIIERKTGIKPEIKSVKVIKPGVLLEMKSLAHKLEIMRRRRSLRVMNIILEDDLTRREQLVQRWLEKIAEEDKKLGKDTIVSFFKIKQDGVWKLWNERTGQLVIDERPPSNNIPVIIVNEALQSN